MTTKQEAMTAFLADGETFLLIDARQPGVDVPPEFALADDLVLKFSYKYKAPHLVLNTWGVRAELSFAGMPKPVAVPWEAVYAMGTNGHVIEYEKPGEPPVTVKKSGGLRLV